jgi:Tfp pilus assembly PilM family ATPase
VLLVIAYRDSVDRYLAATDAASLELAGIDLDAFALLRASVRGVDEVGTAPSALVAVSIDHDLTTLAISDGVACQLTRVLEWGTANVDAALHRSLRVPAEEAEAIRSRVSFEAPADPSAFSQPGPPQPAEVVARELQTLVRELQSSIRFYGSQPAAAPVTALIVSGTLVDIPGFARRLSADLGIEVTAADPYARVEITAGLVRPELSGGLVVAVGLGIEV